VSAFGRGRGLHKSLWSDKLSYYQTATYAHPGVGKSAGYDYSRLQNPTKEHLEKVVASLENGTSAFALSSGMAAISLLMELFKPGDHIMQIQICMVEVFVFSEMFLKKTVFNFQILIVAERIQKISALCLSWNYAIQ